jgi:mRNA turnover protein 4|uniref:Ribosome assembly factor mrt4 n=1 Tax=Favella ehrenbergii TaxID=182087 RepID=A0A7S3MMV9_9SPIT|mmetsp:Transcript_31504/g.41709  ORF Transcript_31504/g.41709 Transcript_31504/m.41709 type:complete len:239 (+) Transcript_31504:20-736(+)|eukprot:CAMPEP_0170457698 /NCGR_PEP_ID=MMETSP0123-20130129/4904_1 /TAXON_ID=182087 /ORGANISM="Favella ehrenbergii, Strain Fehren 1" /LENGTH=238 /DNA_ID=CAMNT_0010721579 /DNA_START=22 /DNA_END=738 /DNA_ORIENTATION=+
MPKSKRNKVVALTKVKTKGRAGKEELVTNVREAVEEYKNAFAVSYENIRSGPFKVIANTWRADSKFFLGKNKVMQVALGRAPEEEPADNTHLVSKYLRGNVCLLLTNKGKEAIEKRFKEVEDSQEDFATAGTPAAYTVFLKKGTESLEGYVHSLEPQLQMLGLPTRLNFQKIELLSDVYICREGQKLNVEQCKLLKILGHKMANFKLQLLCQRSTTKGGQFREFEAGREHMLKFGEEE